MMALASVNPSTGETFKTFSTFTEAQIDEALDKAVSAFEHHRQIPFVRRAQWMLGVAQLLEQEKERLVRIIRLEMGKLLPAGIEEVTCSPGPVEL